MRKFSINEFGRALTKLNLRKGDTLFVHSALLNFGFPTDIPLRELPAHLLDILIDQIGAEGTLAVPTFNFDFCKGLPYNRQETPSKQMGSFSEYVRQLPQSIRSYSPMQSIAVVGRDADYITENDTETAFSPESAIDRLIQRDPKIVTLGNAYYIDSLLHWVEQKHLVPYRYWKTFTGLYTDNDQTTQKSYKMYVRDLKLDPILNYGALEKVHNTQKNTRETNVGSAFIRSFKNNEILKHAEYFIDRNPYYFVSNHPKFGKL